MPKTGLGCAAVLALILAVVSGFGGFLIGGIGGAIAAGSFFVLIGIICYGADDALERIDEKQSDIRALLKIIATRDMAPSGERDLIMAIGDPKKSAEAKQRIKAEAQRSVSGKPTDRAWVVQKKD